MRKLFLVLPVIALTLTGALLATACGGGDSNPEISVVDLKAKIAAANTARFNVATATAANQVPAGRQWVTEAVFTVFNLAIGDAEAVRDNPVSQGIVDSATSALVVATNTFNAAKQNGTGAALKISGTITVKNKGVPVPYVELTAHDNEYDKLSASIRVPLTNGTGNWEVIGSPLASETDLYFRIIGYMDSSYSEELFMMDYVDSTHKTVRNSDINGIHIDKSNLQLIKLYGSFRIDHPETIKSVAIMFGRIDGTNHDGSQKTVMVASQEFPYTNGSTITFSKWIDSYSANTPLNVWIPFSHTSNPWDNFDGYWGGEVVTVKNTDASFKIDLINLSGTFDASSLDSTACQSLWMAILRIEGNYIGEPSGNFNYQSSTNWSAIIPAFTAPTEIQIAFHPYDNDDVFMGEYYLKKDDEPKLGSVYNSSISGINITLPAWNDAKWTKP